MFIQQSTETGTVRRLDCTVIKTSSLQLLGVDGGLLDRLRHLGGNVECVCLAASVAEPALLIWIDLDDKYFSDGSPLCSPRESSRSWPWVRINIICHKYGVTEK